MSAQCDISTSDISFEEVDHEEVLHRDKEEEDNFSIHNINLRPGREEEFVEQPGNQASTEDVFGSIVKDSQDYLLPESQFYEVVNCTPTHIVPSRLS